MNKIIKKTPAAKAKAILKKPYTRRLTPDESGGYVASVLEFPGCIAEGNNAEEALRNLERAAESWIAVSMHHGRKIKDPIDFDGYSGKLALRIPRSLHKQIAELAELEGVSINHLLVSAISKFAGEKDTSLIFNNAIKQLYANYEKVAPRTIYIQGHSNIKDAFVKTLLSQNVTNSRKLVSSNNILASALPSGRSEINYRIIDAET